MMLTLTVCYLLFLPAAVDFINMEIVSVCSSDAESTVSLPSVCSEEQSAADDVISICNSDSEKSVTLPSEVDDADIDDLDLFPAKEENDEQFCEMDADMEASGERKDVFAEIFSRPRVICTITSLCLQSILSGILSVDIRTGYDLTIPSCTYSR